jgi:hypothetical protein
MSNSVAGLETWIDSSQLEAMSVPERVAVLGKYGPISLTTTQPDIPGVRYRLTEDYGKKHGKIAVVRSKRLESERLGDGTMLYTAVSDRREETDLDLNQVVKVVVDHPLRHKMPLNGQATGWVNTEGRSGVPFLRQADHYIEYGGYMRWDGDRHETYHGLAVYTGYSARAATLEPGDALVIPSLEAAKTRRENLGYQPETYLVSRPVEGMGIISVRHFQSDVTSRRVVVARPPRYPGYREYPEVPNMHVEVVEYPSDTSDEGLATAHVGHHNSLRVSELYPGGWPIDQMAADLIMLYAISD